MYFGLCNDKKKIKNSTTRVGLSSTFKHSLNHFCFIQHTFNISNRLHTASPLKTVKTKLRLDVAFYEIMPAKK